ncbi:MAG: histidinol-phosphate transaminase [Proteobacteria bacterium]|nr:histidinol-phosphate transaminase [Pseudomonadota bacterium]
MTMNLLKLATLGVQKLQPYQQGKPISELKREYGINNIIKLASNENPLGPSFRVLAALQSELAELYRYPDGNGFALKQSLSKKLQVKTNSITLGNGSDDLLELVARAFATNEDAILFSEHSFIVYSLVTQAIGATAIVVPTKNWGCDLELMIQKITTNTKVIFIANPNNPTGTWVTKFELQIFLEKVPNHIVIVMDEAYYEYARENQDYPNSLEWLSKYPNLIITRTFSKAYGLAGLRIGYSISHPDIADILNRVRQPFNVNSLALTAATIALQDDEHIQNSVKMNQQGMQQLITAFNNLDLEYIPSLCNFIMVKVGDGAKIYEKLLQQGIITRPLPIPEYLRISIGNEKENEFLIKALQNLFG